MRQLTGLAVVLLALGSACSDSGLPTESVPPQTPAGFRLIGAGDGQVLLAWDPNPEPDLKGYILYRTTGVAVEFRELVRITSTQFADRYLSYDTTYVYRLTAYDFVGNESPPTHAVSVQPLNLSPPVAPRGLVAMGRNWTYPPKSGVEVRWLAGEESDLSHYLVFSGDNALFQPDSSSYLDSTMTTFFTDAGVPAGQTRHYRLVAADLGGLRSLPSNAASDRVLPKARLISPAGNVQVSQPILFQWEAVAGAEAYEVELNLQPYSQIVWKSGLLGAGAASVPYTGPILQSGQSYTWWVAAYSRIVPADSEGRPVPPEPNSQSEYARFIFR